MSYRTVARVVAQLKHLDISRTPLVDRKGNTVYFPPDLAVFHQLRALVESVVEKASTADLDKRCDCK